MSWNKQWEKHGFNKNPDLLPYSEAHMQLSSRMWVRDFIRIKGIETMCDVGCGPAHDLRMMLKEGIVLKNYWGLDVTSGYEDLRPEAPAWAKFVTLPYPYLWPPLRAELIYGRHVLEHQPSPHALLEQMCEASTKYLAHIFFRIPCQTQHHAIQRKHKGFYFNDLSASLLTQEVGELGFELVERRELESWSPGATKNELWLWEKA